MTASLFQASLEAADRRVELAHTWGAFSYQWWCVFAEAAAGLGYGERERPGMGLRRMK